MKKLMMMSVICATTLVFAQQQEQSNAPEAAPECKCGCSAKKLPPPPCAKAEGCRRGMQCPQKEGFPPKCGPKAECGAQRPAPALPRIKKCDCSPDCKGVIILPANSTEGEPLFKDAQMVPCERKEGFRRGPRPGCPRMNGPCPGARQECNKLPPPPPAMPTSPEGGEQATVPAPEAPAPEAPVAE
ncbi:MAG: hypothetical protein IJQ34_04885 [Kiritimatiellae bacterium]|nr:hypothetical protein [Kiritimatiellia bacterium]